MGHLGMNNKILYGIIAVAFVGGMFTVAYAGPIMPKITLSGDVDVTNNLDVGGTLTGVETLHGLSCGLGQIPRWNNIEWQCYGIGSGTPQIKYVTLNDDIIGFSKGWKPDGVVTSYNIIDSDVSKDSLIVVSTQRVVSASSLIVPISFGCTSMFVDNGFFNLSGCSTVSVSDGAKLRYTVINPHP